LRMTNDGSQSESQHWDTSEGARWPMQRPDGCCFYRALFVVV